MAPVLLAPALAQYRDGIKPRRAVVGYGAGDDLHV